MERACIFVFSGTGNTYFVASEIQKRLQLDMPCDLFSIETHLDDVNELLRKYDLIGLGYPIYGSSLPAIVFDWLDRIEPIQKHAFVFCTQVMYSGDGAEYGARLLMQKGIYSQYQMHFNMPNNLTDIAFFNWIKPIRYEKIERYVKRKVEKLVRRITAQKPIKTGRNPFSRFLGFLQRGPYERFCPPQIRHSIRIDTAKCVMCFKCVELCPTGNLRVIQGQISDQMQCIWCYRCVNHCPVKALMVFRPIKQPYLGPTMNFDIFSVREDSM
jgi:flavodoxin/ferredoxin